MESRVIVAAVIEKGDFVLFGRKPDNIGPYPNKLHIPGGGVNLAQESLEDALKREILEETGLKVKIIERLGFDEDYEPNKKGDLTHYIFLVYRVQYLSGEMNAKDDLVKLMWIHKNDLANHQLNRAATKLFREIGYLR